MARQDLARRLYAVLVRHVEVHQDHVGTQLPREPHGLIPIRGLPHHLGSPDGVQQPVHPVPEEGVVVGDKHPDDAHAPRPEEHGSSTRTTVPPPGAPSTKSVPPSSSARSRMEESPTPRPRPAPIPRPSSSTSRRSTPPSSPRPTSQRPAPAWRTTLV